MTLCLSLVWTGKQRTGVVQHLTVDEFLASKTSGELTVITARKHKTGDKEPATIVVGPETYHLLQEYVFFFYRIYERNK